MHKKFTQNGQALIEFCIVASCVLCFLFLFVPFMNKISEARLKTLQASRYAAWERTIYYDKKRWNDIGAVKTSQELKAEANARLLSEAKIPLGSESNGNFKIDPFLYFQNRNKLAGSYEEFLVNHNRTASTAKNFLSLREMNSDAPDLGITLGGRLLQAANLPNLPTDNFYADFVQIELKPLSWWKEFDGHISLEDTNVILADGWSIGSGENFQEKVTEGAEIAANNLEVTVLNKLAGALSLVCEGVGFKCGADFKSDVLTKTSTLPQYVPSQRLER